MNCTDRTRLRRGFHLLGIAPGLCVLILSLKAPASAQVLASEGPKALAITGTVVDGGGSPLSGATVRLRPTESPYDEARFFLTGERLDTVAEDRTGVDGNFSLRAPGPGFWNVHFTKPGFGNARVLPYTAFFQDTRFAPIELGPSRRIEVTVHDQSGEPISGATVQVYPPGYLDIFTKANRSVRVRGAESTDQTNANGIAAVEAIATRGHIVVAAPGYLPTRVEVSARAESATATLEKATLVNLDLQLPGTENRPASGAVIFAGGIAVAMADDDGRVSVAAPEHGSHTIKVLHSSQASLEVELSSATSKKQLTLQPPTQIRGMVLDAETGKGIAGAWVWEWRSHPTQSKVAFDRIKTGAYSLETPAILIDTYHRGQARRSHYIAASAPGYFGEQSSTSDTDFDNHKGATLELKRFARVTGNVVDHRGKPMARVALNAVALDGRGGFGTSSLSAAEPAALSAQDGSFQLAPLISGVDARIDARAAGFATTTVTTPPMQPGGSTAIEIRLVRGLIVSGQVVDEGNVGIPGSNVNLSKTSKGGQQLNQLMQAQMSRSREMHSATTDIDGHFEFIDFSAGHYDLKVTAPSFAPANVPTVEISVPEAPTGPGEPEGPPPRFALGVVALSPGAVLQGVVKDSGGRTVEGAEVSLTESGGGMSFSNDNADAPVVVTDSSGRFEFDSLQSGIGHQLEAKKDGFAEAVLSGAIAPTEEPLEMVLERAVDLTGRVTDVGGKPLAGARVRAQHKPVDGSVQMTQATFRSGTRFESTDSKGDFTLANLKKGAWNLAVSAAGYVDVDHGPIQIDPTKTPTLQTIRLEKGAILEGRITGPDGEPIGKATVGERQTTDPRMRRRLSSTRSDGEGHYALEGLKIGAMTFEARAEGFQVSVRDYQVQPGTNQLDIILETGLVISGNVLGPDGAPVAGARVDTQPANSRRFIATNARSGVLSDADGAFSLKGQSPGTYQVMASKDGLPTASLEAPIIVQADYPGVQLRFTEGASFVGTVSGLSFDELAQVQLFAMTTDRTGSPILGKVDFEGKYRLDNATPGTWQVSANLTSTRRQKTETVEVPEGGGEIQVDFEFNQGLTARGRVFRTDSTGSQLPASQVFVGLRGSDGVSGGSATTDREGHFELTDLQPGEYTLVAGRKIPPGFTKLVQLDADREFAIELTERTLNVRVVDDEVGNPLAGAAVSLSSPDSSFGFRSSNNASMTDENGRFTFSGLGAGEAAVQAQLEGYGATSSIVVIDAAADPPELELRLRAAVPLTVILTDALGGPVHGGSMSVLGPNDRLILTRSFSTSEGGRLAINDVEPGLWTFLFSDSSSTTVRATLRVPEATDTGSSVAEHIQIPPSGNLRVEAPSLADSKTVVSVTLLDASGNVYARAAYPQFREQALAKGRTTILALPIGTYKLRLTTKDGSVDQSGTATVSANTTSVVRIP